MVTATVKAIVAANNSQRRSRGTGVPVPLVTTCQTRLIGGISTGRRTIPAAAHQPRPPGRRCRRVVVFVPGETTSGPATISGLSLHETRLGNESGGDSEHVRQSREPVNYQRFPAARHHIHPFIRMK